jgi:DNA invertase Pin-like site-specific DNA recombinase
VVVSRLDRLARSTREATKILNVHRAALYRALHP